MKLEIMQMEMNTRQNEEDSRKSFCVWQNEANRRLHFVSVVKKMR